MGVFVVGYRLGQDGFVGPFAVLIIFFFGVGIISPPI